jgi:E3 ubiquitin-protein ligase SHPRH
MEAMTGSIGEEDRVLSYTEIAKVLHPLLSLRQACCHPQVGSSGLRSLQKTPMTMDEVLKVLLVSFIPFA